jgi:hypothetical protein
LCLKIGDLGIHRRFRVTSAELSQDAVSVDFSLEDINK